VAFNDCLTGSLTSAQVQVSSEGYFGNSTSRYAEFYADGVKIADLCKTCSRCGGFWQGTQTFDVTSAAADNSVQFMVHGTDFVRNQCDWQSSDHSMLVLFKFSWLEDITNQDNTLKKAVIEPSGNPVTYPADQEKITTISSYVRNAPPIFSYFNENGEQITENPAILSNTTMMKLFMVINIDPERPPADYNLEQYIQLRNLKKE
jgi:hypothetical protein